MNSLSINDSTPKLYQQFCVPLKYKTLARTHHFQGRQSTQSLPMRASELSLQGKKAEWEEKGKKKKKKKATLVQRHKVAWCTKVARVK